MRPPILSSPERPGPAAPACSEGGGEGGSAAEEEEEAKRSELLETGRETRSEPGGSRPRACRLQSPEAGKSFRTSEPGGSPQSLGRGLRATNGTPGPGAPTHIPKGKGGARRQGAGSTLGEEDLHRGDRSAEAKMGDEKLESPTAVAAHSWAEGNPTRRQGDAAGGKLH